MFWNRGAVAGLMAASIVFGGLVLLSGCDSGGGKETNSAQVTAQRQAEIDAQNKASAEAGKQQPK